MRRSWSIHHHCLSLWFLLLFSSSLLLQGHGPMTHAFSMTSPSSNNARMTTTRQRASTTLLPMINPLSETTSLSTAPTLRQPASSSDSYVPGSWRGASRFPTRQSFLLFGWRGVAAQSTTQLSARVGHKEDEERATTATTPSSDRMVDRVAQDKSHSDNDNELSFHIQTAVALVGGQSVLIVAAIGLASLAQTPGLGLGTGFVGTTLGAWQSGVLATLPLGLLAAILDRFEATVPALQKVTQATQRSVLTLLGARFLPLKGFLVSAALGMAAGVGEEWLFRGVLQTELTHLLANLSGASTIAVVLSSIIFGALHAVTPVYAMLATLASLYFGWLYVWSDNLAVSMICHGLYDIGALYYAHWTVAKDLTPQQRNDLLRLPF